MVPNVALYCDGSCPNNRKPSRDNPASWAFVAVRRVDIFDHRAGHEIARASGRVITDPDARGYDGAEHGSNQTAELTAAIRALQWAQVNRKEIGRIALFTDSKYVKNLLLRQWKHDDEGEMENKALVLKARALQDDVDTRVRWVKGHVGIHWNEEADDAAHRALRGVRSLGG